MPLQSLARTVVTPGRRSWRVPWRGWRRLWRWRLEPLLPFAPCSVPTCTPWRLEKQRPRVCFKKYWVVSPFLIHRHAWLTSSGEVYCWCFAETCARSCDYDNFAVHTNILPTAPPKRNHWSFEWHSLRVLLLLFSQINFRLTPFDEAVWYKNTPVMSHYDCILMVS